MALFYSGPGTALLFSRANRISQSGFRLMTFTGGLTAEEYRCKFIRKWLRGIERQEVRDEVRPVRLVVGLI